MHCNIESIFLFLKLDASARTIWTEFYVGSESGGPVWFFLACLDYVRNTESLVS